VSEDLRSAGSSDASAGTDPAESATPPTAQSVRDPSPYERQTTVVARTVGRTVVPLILVTAVALLLQGHNFPGGGFIGGVLTATAFVLLYVIFGLDYLQKELLHRGVDGEGRGMVGAYRWLFSLGLALAAGSGLVPILFGLPFMAQAVAFFHLPLYQELEVASAFFFDLGVYFTVVGALLTVVGEVGAE
jgi:multicomponent Na+:H+ antiporter subunit B